MKNIAPHARRAAAGLIPAAALLAIPAFAQEVAPSVAPPPVRATVSQAAPPPMAPPPVTDVVTPAPSAAPTESGSGSSRTVIAPEALSVRDDARPRTAPHRPAAARAQPAASRASPAIADAAPVAPPVAQTAPPLTDAPAAAAPETASPVIDAPVAAAPVTATSTDTTTTETGAPLWPIFALLAAAVAAIFGFLAWRRQRDAEAYAEPYFEGAVSAPAPVAEPAPAPERVAEPVVEPVVGQRAADAAIGADKGGLIVAPAWPLTAPTIKARKPVAAAPLASPVDHAQATAVATPDEATVHDADGADIASLTAATPVADRPWLEFAMRPVRAGTSSDEAMVEIELTVANSGALPANDVRIATFMLPAGADGEMERLLTGGAADDAIAPTTIDPGEGTRIDAILALLKSDLGSGARGESFSPVIVADARYRLPDGSEGRTAAAFRIGTRDEAGMLLPFALDERRMHDDVEADLHGQPQRA